MSPLVVVVAVQAGLIAWLVYDRRIASRDFIALVDRLCQRLQAPGAAILEHDESVRTQPSPEYAPPALEPDDDEGYWMSRDKLAEYAMNAELERDR